MNNDIFYFFYSFAHQSAFIDKLIVFVAEPFPYIVIVLAILYILFHKDFFHSKNPFFILKVKWREMVLIVLAPVIARVVAYVLKYTFAYPRPFLKLPDVIPLWVEAGYAFPSSHSTIFMALGVAIYLIHKKVGYIFIIFAILIGLARIMAGVHFPVDILGGFILGAGVAYLVKYLNK